MHTGPEFERTPEYPLFLILDGGIPRNVACAKATPYSSSIVNFGSPMHHPASRRAFLISSVAGVTLATIGISFGTLCAAEVAAALAPDLASYKPAFLTADEFKTVIAIATASFRRTMKARAHSIRLSQSSWTSSSTLISVPSGTSRGRFRRRRQDSRKRNAGGRCSRKKQQDRAASQANSSFRPANKPIERWPLGS